MTQHDTGVRLRHMLDAAKEAIAMSRGKTRSDLDSDRKLNLALVRLLEIVGEAASRVPKEECARYTDIPWQIVSQDLPPLIGGLETILASDS